MKITRILVVALAFVGAFTLAQDPGFQLSPPPAVVAPTPAPFQVPVFIQSPAAPVIPDGTWQWIVTYVIVPIGVAIAGLVVAWVNNLKGRMDRQAIKTGQLSDQIVSVAAATPPPPAAVPGTPSSPPKAAPLGLWPVLAAVVALGLTACAGFTPIKGTLAYTDSSGNHYNYVTNPDGTRTLSLADKNGNSIGLTSDGKETRLDLNVQAKKKAGPSFKLTPPAPVPLPLPEKPRMPIDSRRLT